MEFNLAAPPTVANGATCYQCGNASGIVTFDRVIEGEGVLGLCGGCILAAAQLVWDHREREFKEQRALEGRFADMPDDRIADEYEHAGSW